VERGKECGVEFVWLLADAPEPSILVDMCFAWAVSIGRRGTGRNINALRVEFTPAVKIFKCVGGSRSSMMDVEDEHNHMRAAFGLHDRIGQPGTPAAE
jgi:hypothetical protein